MAVDLECRLRPAASRWKYTLSLKADLRCSITAAQPCAEARQHPLTEETLRQQFGRLGGTPYELRESFGRYNRPPNGALQRAGPLRHELVAMLDRLAQAPPPRRIADTDVLASLRPTPGVPR